MTHRFDLKLIWTALLAYAVIMCLSLTAFIGLGFTLVTWGVLLFGFFLVPWIFAVFALSSYLKPKLKTRKIQVQFVIAVAVLSLVFISLMFDAPDFSWIRRGPQTADWIYFRIFALYYTLWAVLYLFFTRPRPVR
jgi:predicted membrane channel-forming protein YqfA (hemolysin III family)